MQVDDGVFVVPLPEDGKDQRRGRDHAQPYDEVRFEPVFALSFVEDHLQCSQAERDKTEADEVDPAFAQFAALEIWRVLDELLRQQKRKNADRDIDEKNPAPAK